MNWNLNLGLGNGESMKNESGWEGPSVYKKIVVESREEVVLHLPEDLEGLKEVAQWMVNTGYANVKDVCLDGFRYRNTYVDAENEEMINGSWMWAEPGDYIVLMMRDGTEPEFDMPVTYIMEGTYSDFDHVDGPSLNN